MAELSNCGDCGAMPGELHDAGCDVERCADCGGQWISCGCPNPARHPRLIWTGQWPGDAEAIEFGWFVREIKDASGRHVRWEACEADDEGARPDTSRLRMQARWDAAAGRYVKR